MTVAELIIELKKLEQTTEVWVDTSVGLLPMDGLYFADNTAIVTFSDFTEDKILN